MLYDVLLFSTASDLPLIRRHLHYSQSERLMALFMAFNGAGAAHWGVTDQSVFVGRRRTYRAIPSRV